MALLKDFCEKIFFLFVIITIVEVRQIEECIQTYKKNIFLLTDL